MPVQWTCHRAASVLVPSGPGEKRHLFALLLEPVVVDGYGSAPQVLMASICTVRPGLFVDQSCLLSAGDHPFITHDSYVDYSFARMESQAHVEQCVAAGTFTAKEDCSPELIRRIIQGALVSKRIPREFKKVLETVLLGPPPH